MKGLLKSLAVVAVVIALAVVAVPAVDAAYTRDLTIGSTGSDVAELQAFLVSKGFLVMPVGVTPGYFGALTQAAVARYQVANGIVPPAGYFGPLTRASVASMGTTAPVAGLPAGCSSTSGFSPTTGVRCDSGSSSSSSSSLSGGAGDIDVSEKTSGTETTVSEGSSEKVLGLEIEADDNSDIEITSIRLIVTPNSNGSTRLTRYAEEIVIEHEGKEVGSIDASDFSRSGAVHTGTVSLKGAIVDGGDKDRFDVVFVARDSIDSDDQDNKVNVKVDRIRFVDATGAIMSETPSPAIDVDVAFEDASENDDLRLQTSSSDPAASTLEVNETLKSDEFQVFAFTLRAGSESSDLNVIGIDVDAEISNPSAGTLVFDSEDLISDIWLEVDGQVFDDWSASANASTDIATGTSRTITYSFEIDEGDLEIEAGDRVEAEVYVVFGKQSNKYNTGTTIQLSVAKADISVENVDGDAVTVAGATTVTGEEHTVLVEGVFAEFVSSSFTAENATDSIDGTISLVFELTAVGEDAIFAEDGSDFTYAVTGATKTDAVVTVKNKTASGGNFTITEGDSKQVTLSAKFATTTGFVRLEITDILGTPVNNIITPAY